ncbi:hypothetical protein [uncultured Mucilaginibacter sp.]|uniref:hypothetical protein n=1 Tax=uncultured Mucilaginibacter sp. TaxID=797541 RepID=UPI00260A7087|nr:hypothetical protein [uncultured Mucilaginibacter sp.]
MIRRDFIQAEIAKLAQALAKILGLKAVGNTQEAEGLINKLLLNDFDLELDNLLLLDEDQFKKLLADRKYPPQKLDLLSQFLLESISPFQPTPKTFHLLDHILLIYQILEQEHHTQSFENLSRKQNILQFLNQNEQHG